MDKLTSYVDFLRKAETDERYVKLAVYSAKQMIDFAKKPNVKVVDSELPWMNRPATYDTFIHIAEDSISENKNCDNLMDWLNMNINNINEHPELNVLDSV